MKHVSEFNPRFNVKILVYERGPEGFNLVGTRETHNVLTDFGRTWLLSRLGSSNYAAATPPSHTDAVIQYMGFGCGGALQTDTRFLRSQLELVSVTGLQEPVPFSLAAPISTFLKTVENQSMAGLPNADFPAYNRTVFTLDVLETEISYAASQTYPSLVNVGTSVPVSEAGLYLSTATDTFDMGAGGDPTAANELVCYNIFDPIPVNPNTMLRVQWELRV
jgi:hypothetical protein